MNRALVTIAAAVWVSSVGVGPVAPCRPGRIPAPGPVGPAPVPAAGQSAAEPLAAPDPSGNPRLPTRASCSTPRWRWLRVNYEDFAYASAGNGN